MTDNDGSHVGQRVEVLLDPSDIDNIQVVGRFIQQKDIGLLKHGTRQSELHAPPTREGRHGVIGLGLAVVSETDRGQHRADFILGDTHGLNLFIGKDVLDARKMGLFPLDIGFDENGTDGGRVGETLDLVVGNGTHQSGLTTIVGSEKTVTLTALELHLGVVQQNLGTVGQGERTVAEFLCIIVVIFLFGNDQHFFGFDTNGFGGFFSLGFVKESQKLGGDLLGPLQVLHEEQVHHGSGDGRGVLNDSQKSTIRGVDTKGLLEFSF